MRGCDRQHHGTLRHVSLCRSCLLAAVLGLGLFTAAIAARADEPTPGTPGAEQPQPSVVVDADGPPAGGTTGAIGGTVVSRSAPLVLAVDSPVRTLTFREAIPAPEASSESGTSPTEETTAAAGAVPSLILSHVPVGVVAEMAVLSPDERFAYVTAGGDSAIVVVALDRPRVVHRFRFTYSVEALAISGDGTRLFVSAITPVLPPGPCGPSLISPQSSSLVIVDAHSGETIGTVPLPSVAWNLLPSADNRFVTAVTDTGIDLVDLQSMTVTDSIPAPAGQGTLREAVLAPNGEKVFVGAVAFGVAVFDLAAHSAHALGPPPAGYSYATEGAMSAAPELGLVFCSLIDSRGFRSLAAVDAATEEVRLATAAGGGASGGVLYSQRLSRLFLPGSRLVLDSATLATVGQLPSELFPNQAGVTGQLSPDQSFLYLRPIGSTADSVTFFNRPVNYDFSVVDTRSLRELVHVNLDAKPWTCSGPTPLLLGRSGRLLVAPNSSLQTVTVIKVCSRGHSGKC